MSKTCLGCGRWLYSLKSQRIGYGRRCLAKRRREIAAGYKPFQVDKARRLRSARALKRVRPGVYRVAGKYLTTKEQCNCPSGLYRGRAKTCYHSLAVSLETP